jgi:hypothetical protein
MPRDPRVDAYIASRNDFAKPILNHLRELIHRHVPAVEETVKWSMPFFTYKGQLLANMAAFKEHAAFGFWDRLGLAIVEFVLDLILVDVVLVHIGGVVFLAYFVVGHFDVIIVGLVAEVGIEIGQDGAVARSVARRLENFGALTFVIAFFIISVVAGS